MKIVVATSGSRGDVQPMALLAEALFRRGHEVTLFAPKNVPVALSPGIRLVDEGMDAQAIITQHRADIQSHLGFLRVTTRVVEEEIARQFRILLPLVRGADLLVGGGVMIAGASVGEASGVPFVPVAYVTSIIESPSHAPIILPLEGTPRWANKLLWRLGNAFLGVFAGRPLNREREALGLAPARRFMTHVRGPHRALLAADPELMPLPDDLRESVHATGAWTHDEPLPLSEELERFLASGAPPVYVGFGSMGDPRPAETTRIVARVAERLGVRVVLGAGWAGLGEGALPSNVFAVGNVSHPALFPRVSIVVHHGGAGTTAAAMRAGKPQAIVPHIADQYSIARRLAELGVSPRFVARKRLDVARLASLIEEASDPRLHAAATALGETLRARDGLAEAVAFLERRGWERSSPAGKPG